MRSISPASATRRADGGRLRHPEYPLEETSSVRHIVATSNSAWLLFTNSKTSPAPSRSPEQTRPRLLPESPALCVAAHSHDAAAAAPPAPPSSARRYAAPRPNPPAAPSCQSPAPTARTPVTAPPACAPTAPTPPSAAETPADTPCVYSPS